MSDHYKGKAKNILAWLSVLPFIILTYCSNADNSHVTQFHNSLTQAILSDTIPLPVVRDTTDSLQRPRSVSPGSRLTRQGNRTSRNDTIIKPVVDTFSFTASSDSLSEPAVYHADDSMILDVPGKKLLLYGKTSSIKYATNELTAPHIEYDQSTNLVKAYLKRDSTGKVISFPSFNQGDFKSVSDSIIFNPRTGKGITKGTYTQQGEMYVYGEKIKKAATDIFYALNARFTTCNLDTPHFAFVSKRIKFITDKMAFSGPVHPEFEGVPLPIYLPFGIYPLARGRHSGLIAPSFTVNDQLGFALDRLGYYKILGPNWDVITTGTVYSYGGWSAHINPRYYKRYKFQGNFNLDIQKTKLIDQPSSRTIAVQWLHNADTKSRPGVTFSANVNASSSKHNENIPNNNMLNFTNSLNSSIRYAKTWKDKPYNISLSANHSQNTVNRQISLMMPDVNFNLNTIFPFRRKEPIGEYKWYENLGIALNTLARSQTNFIDTAGEIGKQIKDNFQWGASHNVPITLSLPELGPIQVAPTVTYAERWFQRSTMVRFNSITEKLDTVSQRDGFFTDRDMSFGLGFSTRIFGLFTFKKNSKVQAIRHEIRPSLSFNYNPNLSKGSYLTQIDTAGNLSLFNRYTGGLYGVFGGQKSAGLGFALDNNLGMKVRNKKDTSAEGLKKVVLIDGLGLTGFYDFMRDSFKMTDLSISARSNLFEKIGLTATAIVDPYQRNAEGNRIDKLEFIRRPWSLGSLVGANISLRSQFRGGDKKPGEPDDLNQPRNVDASGVPLPEYQAEAAYIRNNPAEYVDFSIPWSIDFGYAMNYSRTRSGPGFRITGEKSFTQNIDYNASVNLTPKWKIGSNGYYNITTKEIGSLSMYLSREMHCWQMAINISPVGRFRYFSINISPKSSLLRDLKINRTRSFYDR